MGQPDSALDGIVGVVVLAAGSSARMGGQDKIFADLNGSPVVAHSLRVFETQPAVDCIVLVVSEANIGRAQRLARSEGWKKVAGICVGGARRQDSVAAGLRLLDNCDWIAIHDAARPFIDPDLVARGLAAVRRWGAAIPGIPLKDTIKVVQGEVVMMSLDRASLVAGQTPQFFKSAIIKEAHAAFDDDVTDDAMLVERLGYPVGVFEGAQVNMKITTPEDLAVARFLLGRRDRGAIAG